MAHYLLLKYLLTKVCPFWNLFSDFITFDKFDSSNYLITKKTISYGKNQIDGKIINILEYNKHFLKVQRVVFMFLIITINLNIIIIQN